MNDEIIEQHLRNLPAPELPMAWREEILSMSLRAAREPAPSREAWPPFLVVMRNFFARNPWTSGALTAMWLLIFLFKASTPVDPTEKALIAHIDPNRPVYIVSLRDEIQLAELLQDPLDQSKLAPIP